MERTRARFTGARREWVGTHHQPDATDNGARWTPTVARNALRRAIPVAATRVRMNLTLPVHDNREAARVRPKLGVAKPTPNRNAANAAD